MTDYAYILANLRSQLVGDLTEEELDALNAGVGALNRIRKAREAELFEDGCEADLHDAGIKTLPAAYMQGRLDVLDEIDGN